MCFTNLKSSTRATAATQLPSDRAHKKRAGPETRPRLKVRLLGRIPPDPLQYEKVPKNAERLFGSLHFVPRPVPLKECWSATPISESDIDESGWNHCIAP